MDTSRGTTSGISLAPLFAGAVGKVLGPIEPALSRLLALDRLGNTFDRVRTASVANGNVFQGLLRHLQIDVSVSEMDLARVPATGAVVAVANHPFGMLEGAVLGSVLSRVRPDFKIMANSMLAGIPELREHFLFVNPFGGRRSVIENRRPLVECMEWLRAGGMLVIFPAGEVSHLDLHSARVADPAWNAAIARLIRRSGCDALPMYFRGANSLKFHMLGMVHPGLRTVRLPRELLNKRGKTVELRIGRVVAASAMASFESDSQAIEYLRCRTELLANRDRDRTPAPRPLLRRPRAQAQIHSGPDAASLASEVAALAPQSHMARSGELTAIVARSEEIPSVLDEIGRLRELTFRNVGEGGGASRDLDRFDRHYLHLFLWNENTREVVGAYRLAPTPDILPREGVRGLYTSTLFHFHPRLFARIGPAIELGRSFVRVEYQRQFAPLLLLWKGITRYVSSRPSCAVLFGGVSVSNAYNPASRHLLVRYLESKVDPDLVGLVRPRTPYRPRPFARWHGEALTRLVQDVEELSDPIADMEDDGKGVPVLIRQYMKAGGRMLGFNVDPEFSNTLDGLILVDLRKTPRLALDRYMGKSEAAAFRTFHGLYRD